MGQLIPAVKNSWSMEKLLVVRQSVFECGGICISHKVADANTACSFLKSWSATARGGGTSSSSSSYVAMASSFPPKDVLARPAHPELMHVSRRFVLSGSQIASLKAKSCSQSVAHPTRVEAVSSLIRQCAIRSKSSNMKNPSSSLSSSIWQSMNLRSRIDPPFPESTFGNFIGFYRTSTIAKLEEEKEKDDELASLVNKIRHAKEEYIRVYPKKLNQARDPSSAVCESFRQLAGFEEINGGTYFISSVCKFDLYGAGDFGKHHMDLSDTRDDGEESRWDPSVVDLTQTSYGCV